MKLEHYSEELLKKQIRDIVFSKLDKNTYKVFIFGSRVNGKSYEQSDIDIGIIGDQPIPYNVLSNIREELEKIRTLYSFDVIDFISTAKTFTDFALQHIEYING